MRLSLLLAATLLVGAGTASLSQTAPRLKLDFLETATKAVQAKNPRQIEDATGGRLGIALVDAQGKLILGFNREERFAMCSTFKAPLAAAILAGADKGRYSMGDALPIHRSDVLEHAPVVAANVKKGSLPIATLAKAAVEVSDNSAANLLLPLVGGPDGLTAFLRAHGDAVTRLDRSEPALNENALGDERDTTSPLAMTTAMARLLFQDLPAPAAQQLRGWLEGSTTGGARIRAGLPQGWRVGDKTGSCGTAFNDVAVLQSPAGKDYVLAIYLDRPAVDAKRADAAIAEATRAAIAILIEVEKRAAF
jgi:beta-lactamase class A